MIVYTAITNHYDTLKAPLVTDPGVRYIAYVDSDSYDVPTPWEVRCIDVHERNPRVTSRRFKLLPHLLFPYDDLSIWIDASLQVTRSLLDLAEGVEGLAAFAHPERDCIYTEAEAVIKAGVALPERVNRQMALYQGEGYPPHRGLFMGGFLIRCHHNPALNRAGEHWFADVCEYSQRDQLSGMVALWREGMTYQPLPGKLTDYTKYIHHPHTSAYREVDHAV